MSFEVREVREDDLIEIAPWFRNIKWPSPAIEGSIPKSGFLCEYAGVPKAVAFLYLDGTSGASFSWSATDPESPIIETSKAMDMVIERIKEVASKSKLNPPIRFIETYTQSKAFSDKLKKLGFRIETGYFKATYVIEEPRDAASETT